MTVTGTHNSPTKPVNQSSSQILFNKFQACYPQLNKMDDPFWQDVLDSGDLVQLPAHTMVLEPPSPCSHFILILDGCVRVFQQTPEDREITLYRTYQGDLCVLSINGMMHNRNFGAFAITETPLEALSMTRENFMLAMGRSEKFREFVLINLTDRIHDVLELVETTVFESLDTRLMCHLNRLSRSTRSDRLQITHQELARELGTSREVISRILKAFEHQGCIHLERGIVQINL